MFDTQLYFQDNAIYMYELYLYFPSSEVEHWVKYESYGVLTLISNIGGMLGLLLGASVMTLFTTMMMLARKGTAILKENNERKTILLTP